MTSISNPTPWEAPQWIEWSRWLVHSFHHWVGESLVVADNDAEIARALFDAKFVVVSHGMEADPLLNYGNATALALWEMSLDEFLGTPSRLTAESLHRDERARLLQQTARQGFVDNYRGIRISRTGKRFLIEQAFVWNVMDDDGRQVGQAAKFANWTPLAGASTNDT